MGLAFAPARGRTLPDITGTLWIDRTTAMLHHLDFSYIRLPEDLVAPRAGGRIEFLRVPSGAWIVRDWVIRMPQAVMKQRPMGMGTYPDVVGFKEVGGNAVEIKTRTGTIIYRSDSLVAALAAAPPAAPAPLPPLAPAAPPPVADASPSVPAPAPAREGTRNPDLIEQSEIEGSTALDAMALVQEFRPNWLRSRGVVSIRDQTAGLVKVYINGVQAGDVSRLREIRAEEVRWLRHLGAAEAQQRYGLGHAGGVIEVWTR